MSDVSLRARKKEQTRRLIAETAAGLFADRGYENVAITDVAAGAGVAEQTVYNYFPTKERLVLDLEQPLQERLVEVVRTRQARTTPAEAVRPEALAFAESIRALPAKQLRGGLGHLAAVSPGVRRLSLEMTDRLAAALAVVIEDSTSLDPWAAKLEGVALASVFQTITHETGRRSQAGQPPGAIADALGPIVSSMFDHLTGARRARRPS